MNPAVGQAAMKLGEKAPNFTLVNTIDNERVSIDQAKGSAGLVVCFICNHCPYVVHVHEPLVELGLSYHNIASGIGVVAISANDVDTYPQDGSDKMRELAQNLGLTYPYLYDETQEVAIAYHAVCTPEFFLFDADLKLVYNGRMDATRPHAGKASGDELFQAIEAVQAGKLPNPQQNPAVGCSIKWKA